MGRCIVVFAIWSCIAGGNERPDEPEPTVRSPQETVAGLLEVELKLTVLADFISNDLHSRT